MDRVRAVHRLRPGNRPTKSARPARPGVGAGALCRRFLLGRGGRQTGPRPRGLLAGGNGAVLPAAGGGGDLSQPVDASRGGLYQWAKAGFGEMAGFLIAWNLWVYAVVVTGAIIFVVPTDISYMLGPSMAWLPSSKLATLLLTGSVMVGITWVAVRGLNIGKWLHNAGSVMILTAYAILLGLPLWALARGSISKFEAVPWQLPKLDWFSLAIFGQMTVGALSGFEYVAILAGECRSAARTIGQSVVLSAPVIALMFILC